jgi:hypothetical protein
LYIPIHLTLLHAERHLGCYSTSSNEGDQPALTTFAEADRETAARLAEERFGMTDAAESVNRFMELVAKWEEIAEEVGPNAEAMAERMGGDPEPGRPRHLRPLTVRRVREGRASPGR